MPRVSDGIYAKGSNSLESLPTDFLSTLNIDTATDITFDWENGFSSDMNLDIGNLMSMTVENGKIDIGSSLKDKFDGDLADTFGMGDVQDVVDYFAPENGVNFQELKDTYDAIEDGNFKAYATNYFMKQTGGRIEKGDLGTLSQIHDVFGLSMNSYFPNLVSDTLKHFNFNDWGIPFNEIGEYCDKTFTPTLDKLQSYWHQFTDFANVKVNVPNLDVFRNASKSARDVFSHGSNKDYRAYVSAVENHQARTAEEMRQTFRPYRRRY